MRTDRLKDAHAVTKCSRNGFRGSVAVAWYSEGSADLGELLMITDKAVHAVAIGLEAVQLYRRQ